MIENCYRFHDLFDQLGLPSTAEDIAAFLKQHSPLASNLLLVDAPFWNASQIEFIREKKATDDPQWVPLIDQLNEALRDDPQIVRVQTKVKLLGISGSLRAASFNTALLNAAQGATPNTATLDMATLHGIPLYDGDLEAKEGLPSAVLTLRESIQAADGIVLVTPEYNNGIPGVFKNAIDWVSRASAQHPDVLKNKPVALMGASPGGFGTISSQQHWLPVLRALGMVYWSSGKLMVSRANTVLQEGKLTDPILEKQLVDFMQAYTSFVMQQTR